jgi:UrcA family protein
MAIRFASLALAAALVSAPAFAAPAADGMSRTVRFADLDLSTDAGATALRQRVHYAARMVCGGDVDQRDLVRVNAAEACRRVAMASAEPQVQLALGDARDGRQLAANDMKVATPRGF